MANYLSAFDLVSDVLSRCGELTSRSGASDFEAAALQYINKMHLSILAGGNELDVELGEQWVWAKAQYPKAFALTPAYGTGTVTLTSGSTAGVFSAAPAISLAGTWLKISGRSEYFRITAHTAATTSFTIDLAYTDDSGAGLSYSCHYLDYQLATDVLRIIGPMRIYQTQSAESDDTGMIEGVSWNSMIKAFPMHKLEIGMPTKFAQSYRSSSSTQNILNIRVNKSPNDLARAEFDYIPVPADLTDISSSIPLVPREHRVALSYGATYYLMLDKNDSRAPEFKLLAQGSLQALINANRKEMIQQTVASHGRLIPRLDLAYSNSKRYVSQEVIP